MTSEELNVAIATFDNAMAAKAAADAAMPRRRHNRPYPQISGWHWARSVACPACGAIASVDCPERLHREREQAARALGAAANRWIVCVYPNMVLLRDGTMYDHQRQVTVRQ
jgi:hypothetical protein